MSETLVHPPKWPHPTLRWIVANGVSKEDGKPHAGKIEVAYRVDISCCFVTMTLKLNALLYNLPSHH